MLKLRYDYYFGKQDVTLEIRGFDYLNLTGRVAQSLLVFLDTNHRPAYKILTVFWFMTLLTN